MMLVATMVILLGILVVIRSRIGLALAAIRDNEAAASALGVNPTRLKLLFVAVGAATALVGAIGAFDESGLLPVKNFSLLEYTAFIIFIVVIGGIGSFEGPIIGTVIYFVADKVLTGLVGEYFYIVLGVIGILVMLFAPKLAGGWCRSVPASPCSPSVVTSSSGTRNKMPDFIPLKTAIARSVTDGCSVALEGFTHLIPHAAAHEIIRPGAARPDPDADDPGYDLRPAHRHGLCVQADLLLRRQSGVGLLRRMRDAVENGWPVPLEIEEHSHAAMAHAYEAGASNMPFALMRGYIGAGLREVNPNIKSVTRPFTGEELFPALRPDVGIIHAAKADRQGNVLIEGILGVQKETVLAAKTAIVTVEQVVDDLQAHPNACVLPGWTIGAICEVPGGAHPSYVHGVYPRDNSAYVEWDEIASDRDRFQAWMQTNVLDVDDSVLPTGSGADVDGL